jgi:hypothetical protein
VIGRRPETFNGLDACPRNLDASPFGVALWRPERAELAGEKILCARAQKGRLRVLTGAIDMRVDMRMRLAADLPESRPLIHDHEAVESTI